MRNSDKVLHAKHRTSHVVFGYQHSVQIGDELLTGTLRAVNWNTWNFQRINNEQPKHTMATHHTQLDTVQTLCKRFRARKPACVEKNDRTSPMSGRLLVEDRSSCRCSRTKDWYSARPASKLRSRCLRPSPQTLQAAIPADGVVRSHIHQWQLQGKSSLSLVQYSIGQWRW